MFLPRRYPDENSSKLDQRGFTLIELVIIIVTLGILAAVAIPKFGELAENSKKTATRDELQTLKRAIVGNAQAISGGKYVDKGFEGDIGYPPSRLEDLVSKPDSIPNYDKLTGIGWNGPYIDSSGSSYLADAWKVPYVYQPSYRRLVSVGGSDSIIVTF
jgi:type II secretory pathway pseudopilin PulG